MSFDDRNDPFSILMNSKTTPIRPLEPFDPADYERPLPPPILRAKPESKPAEAETIVHLVQIIYCATGSGSMSTFQTWCGGRPVAAAFDPRVATCKKCLRELHEAVSQ